MKNILSAILLVALATSAQTGIRKIVMIADIVQMDGTRVKAFVHSITDSAIYLMDVAAPVYSTVDRAGLQTIDPLLVNTIKIKKKKQIAQGIAIGMLTGLATGAIIGLASYRDPGPDAFLDFGPGFDAAAGAGIGLPIGGVFGAIIAIPKVFKINGDLARYREMQLQFHKRIRRK